MIGEAFRKGGSYFGIDVAENVINEARATLDTHNEKDLLELEKTARTALVSLAEQLNIQQCPPISFFAAAYPASPAAGVFRSWMLLEFNLKTGEVFQKLPSGQKHRIENPRALADNADTILPIFKELAIASLPAS